MDRKKDLYKLQMRHLPLQAVESRLSFYQTQLNRELKAKGIRFPWHIWVSNEWFCPDGIPGFALPFYLFNPILMKIQKEEMGQVEGRTDREILRLMRHELGHAIDNAFALRKNKQRQLVFGTSKADYPEAYRPRAYSKNYVNYLGDNYAQSHPDEDFAETFAYWLDPSSQWRKKKLSLVAKQKLHFMNKLMKDVATREPVLKNRFKVDPLEKLTGTLAGHYHELKTHTHHGIFERIDHSLKSSFESVSSSRQTPVAGFLRHNLRSLCRQVSEEQGVYQYEAERGVRILIKRAQGLGLKASRAQLKAKSPSLIQRNFRYLKQKDQLKYYL